MENNNDNSNNNINNNDIDEMNKDDNSNDIVNENNNNKIDYDKANKQLAGVLSIIALILVIFIAVILILHFLNTPKGSNGDNKKKYQSTFDNSLITSTTSLSFKLLSLSSKSDDDLYEVRLKINTSSEIAMLGSVGGNDYLYYVSSISNNYQLDINFTLYDLSNDTYVTSYSDLTFNIYLGDSSSTLLNPNKVSVNENNANIKMNEDIYLNKVVVEFKI